MQSEANNVFINYSFRSRTEGTVRNYSHQSSIGEKLKVFNSNKIPVRLLRTTNILNTSKACRAALEKKIGMQLEQATLDDLLIRSYSIWTKLYDVDCVERILNHFLDGLQETNQTSEDGNNVVKSPTLMLFGKLIDGYFRKLPPMRISNQTNSIKRLSSVACSSCNPIFFSNAAL